MAGAAWNRDGVIVVGMNGGPLLRFSASGGMAIPATTLDKNETSHGWPQFLPDGRHFLYLRVSADPNKTGVYIGSIDAQPAEQSTTRILASNRQAYYAAAAGGGLGHLVFMRESAVMAQPFDPGTTELSGEPAAIAEGVDSFGPAAFGQFSVSNTGTLVYRGGAASRMVPTWFDSRGNRSGVLGDPVSTRIQPYHRMEPALPLRSDRQRAGTSGFWRKGRPRGSRSIPPPTTTRCGRRTEPPSSSARSARGEGTCTSSPQMA